MYISDEVEYSTFEYEYRESKYEYVLECFIPATLYIVVCALHNFTLHCS